jgi:hypothetical protein
MTKGISKLFEDSESLMDQRRLVPALEKLELARQLTKIPERRAWATYNIGVLHWMRFGNGDAARREFLAAIENFETHGYGKLPQALKIMHAGAIENAMLCALSFDEFEELASRLRVLTPDMPILAGLLPKVREARERGEPWSNLLFLFASSYYNRTDPKRDAGRYGEAKSTYHLLITHRRRLRLKREDWRIAVSELCKLAMRLSSDCMKIRGGDEDAHSPEEFLPIPSDAITVADEYLAMNSGDDDLRQLRSILETNITTLRQRWAEVAVVVTPEGSKPGCASVVMGLLVVSVIIAYSVYFWINLK